MGTKVTDEDGVVGDAVKTADRIERAGNNDLRAERAAKEAATAKAVIETKPAASEAIAAEASAARPAKTAASVATEIAAAGSTETAAAGPAETAAAGPTETATTIAAEVTATVSTEIAASIPTKISAISTTEIRAVLEVDFRYAGTCNRLGKLAGRLRNGWQCHHRCGQQRSSAEL